jgi:alpha-L-rhamnosidase
VVSGIDWARGEYLSPRGRIASSWRREPGRLVVAVEVPVNAVAELHLPAGAGATIRESGRLLASSSDVDLRSRTADTAVVALGSGRYRFEVKEDR